jgi:eukaryotic-like serine/threonine-protein kinase
MDQETDHLLSVAGAVAEQAPVSWDDEARDQADEESLSILRGLQELAGIIAAHRHVDSECDTTAPRQSTIGAGVQAPPRWRHLIILDKIGEGSFGTVYRAYDSQLAVDVALKLLSRSQKTRMTSPDRLLNEAQLLARVRHQNVVTVYGADDTEDYVGLWMEFIKGRTLAELLRTQGTFGAHEAALIGRDLCRAVSAVHLAGILHGDIKAHNVMRQEGGRIVLMDFGAGHVFIDERSRAPRNVIGTPSYLAPEVLEGKPPTTSSDIYALGVLLYHLATGSYPVSRESLTGIVQAHKSGERRHLRDVRPDLPDDFVRIVEQATAVDPAQRFASAGAFEAALVRMTSPVQSESLRDRQGERWSVSPISRWAMVLVVLGVLVGGGATVVWRVRTIKPAPEPPGLTETVQPPAPSSAVPAPLVAPYEIDAAFYRVGRNGEERLSTGSHVSPGDELILKMQSTVPVNVYVVNEDEDGNSIREFPLPGEPQANPIQPDRLVTLPGTAHWVVTTPGRQEHFLVFVSPDRLEPLEQVFAQLPSPQENAAIVTKPSLPPESIERLRAVGGLTPDRSKRAGNRFSQLFTTPLTNAREQVRGLWVRQLTLENPGR